MVYSEEFKREVIAFVRAGGGKSAAKRKFGVSRPCIDAWLRGRDPLSTVGKCGPKKAVVLDEAALIRAVAARPDARLKDLACEFDVHLTTIHYGLKRLGVGRNEKREFVIPEDLSERARRVLADEAKAVALEAGLIRAVAARPDARLKDLARELGVHFTTIHYALKRLGIRRDESGAFIVPEHLPEMAKRAPVRKE